MNKVQQTLGAMALSIGIVANSTFAEETKATTAHTQTAVRIAMAKTGKYIHTGTSKADEGLRKLKEELEHLKVKGKEKAFERFIKQIEIFKSNKNYSKLVELLKDKDISVDVLDYIEENGYPINTANNKEFSKFVNKNFGIILEESLDEQLEHLELEGREGEFETFIKQVECFKSDKSYSELVEGLKDATILEYVREEGYPIDTPNNKAFSKFIENTLGITLGGSLKKL